jgi:hypothetical protein
MAEPLGFNTIPVNTNAEPTWLAESTLSTDKPTIARLSLGAVSDSGLVRDVLLVVWAPDIWALERDRSVRERRRESVPQRLCHGLAALPCDW